MSYLVLCDCLWFGFLREWKSYELINQYLENMSSSSLFQVLSSWLYFKKESKVMWCYCCWKWWMDFLQLMLLCSSTKWNFFFCNPTLPFYKQQQNLLTYSFSFSRALLTSHKGCFQIPGIWQRFWSFPTSYLMQGLCHLCCEDRERQPSQ